MLNVTANELAEEFDLKLIGDGQCALNKVSSLSDAEEGSLSFMKSSKYASHLAECKASALIIPADMKPVANGKAYLLSENPYISFAKVLEKYYVPKREAQGVHPQSYVHPTAKIGDDATVEAFAFIGKNTVIGDGVTIMSGCRVGRDVKIGNDVTLHANVVVEDRTILGQRVILHPGVVVGSDGFGYTQTEGVSVRLPHVGYTELGDDVEVGANSTIDRAPMGRTYVGLGTKIDNLVQIGHGAEIGPHNVICAQSGLAGSVKTGEKMILGSKSGISDHIKIGSGVMIGPMSGVVKDVEDGKIVSGFPAIPHGEWLKMISVLGQLPALRKEIKAIKKQG